MEEQTQNVGNNAAGGANANLWVAAINLVSTAISSLASLEMTKKTTEAARDVAEFNLKESLEGKIINQTSNLGGLITLGVLAVVVAVMIFALANMNKKE